MISFPSWAWLALALASGVLGAAIGSLIWPLIERALEWFA